MMSNFWTKINNTMLPMLGCVKKTHAEEEFRFAREEFRGWWLGVCFVYFFLIIKLTIIYSYILRQDTMNWAYLCCLNLRQTKIKILRQEWFTWGCDWGQQVLKFLWGRGGGGLGGGEGALGMLLGCQEMNQQGTSRKQIRTSRFGLVWFFLLGIH